MAKLRELKKITNIFETFDRNATLALYEVARLITISGEPRTIVEKSNSSGRNSLVQNNAK